MQELLGVENPDSPNVETPKSNDTCPPPALEVPLNYVTPTLVRSGIAGSRFQLSWFLALGNPECRNSDSTPPVSTSGEAYALTPVPPSFYREIVNREFAFPDAQDHSPCKTPNSDSSGSCATYPLSDQRLQLIREIAGCDFKGG
jgi:hypothetical protein